MTRRFPRYLALGVIVVLVACTRSSSSDGAASVSPSEPGSPTPSAASVTTTSVRLVSAGYSLPTPVERAVAVFDGTHVLIAGGLDAAGGSAAGVYQLDPTTGSIRQVGTLPQAFHDGAGAMIGSSLVVFGGGSVESTDTVQAFDTTSKQSRVLGHLPTALSDLAAATIGDTVYLVGGWDGTTPQRTIWSTTDGRRFVNAGSLPAGVRYPAVASDGTGLVIAGGLLGSGAESRAVLRFDPTSGKTTNLGKLPAPLAHAMAFAANGSITVAGGQDAVGNPVSAVTTIDPAQGTVVAGAPLAQPVSDAAVATGPSDTLLIGGFRSGTVAQVLRTKLVTTSADATPAATQSSSVAPLSADAKQRPFAGLLLIADRGNDRLIVVDAKKRIVWQYPSPSLPQPTVPFYFPDDAFWVHGGHAILVNQEENNVLTEIAYPSGRTLWTYGHPRVAGSSPGYVHQPDDLYPYPFGAGGLVVADAKNCRILFFGPAGRPTRQIGRTGDCTPGLPATIGYPNASTPLSNGDLLVTELVGGAISRVTTTGKVVWQRHIQGIDVPSDPQLLPDGSIIAVDYGHPGAVERFLSSGRVLWTYRPTSGNGELDHPSLAAPLPNGLVAVNDDYRDRVILIDPTTDRIVWQYGITGVAGTGRGSLNTPDGLDLLLPGGVIPLHLDFASAAVHGGRP